MTLLALALLLTSAPDRAHLEVQHLFHDGGTAAALAKADACASQNAKCRQMAQRIREFSEKRARLGELPASELSSLLRLDQELAGGSPSADAQPIIAATVTSNYARALLCRGNRDWSCALEYSKRVLEAEPSHLGAQAIVADARNASKEIYLRAYQLRDDSPENPAVVDGPGGRIILVADGDIAEAPAQELKIDPAKSELYVKTFKEGVASAFAHNHVVVASKLSGTLTWDPNHLERCKLKVTVPVNDLVVDDPVARKKVGGDWGSEVSEGDRKSIRQNMLADIQLDAKKYPEISLEADNFKCRGSGQCELDGKLTLHGVTKAIHFTAKIKADGPSGEGSFKFNTSDYGIKPYSAGLGTIKNKDEVELVFRLTAAP